MQKIRKLHTMILTIPEKPHFGSISGSFWPRNIKTRFYPRLLFRLILNYLPSVTWLKYKKNPDCQFFVKLEKPHFGTIWPKNPGIQFFFQKKKPASLFFKLDDTLISCKKCLTAFLKKKILTNEQTERGFWKGTHTYRNCFKAIRPL